MNFKKLTCLALALVILLATLLSVHAETPVEHAHEWENEIKTDCNGECGVSPLIVVPGIMQSQVYVQDENGGDLMTSDGFPIVEGMDMQFMFDTEVMKAEFKSAIGDILRCVLKRDRQALLDIVIGILDESFSSHYFNPDGTRVNGVAVDEYWYSLEECASKPEKSYNYAKGYSKDDDGNALPTTKYEHELDFIKRQVDISSFCDKYGYDHAYYYSYSSFGNILESAKGLSEYIEMVKAQTGHDKVSIVFISLGGTIGNVFLSKYANPEDLDRVVFAAAAIDGSYLLADLMDGASTLDNNEVLYNDLIPNIVSLAAEEYMSLAYLGNVVAKAIPSELFNDFLAETLSRGIDEVLAKLMRNCQSMWALVPSGVYPELSQKYISDSEHSALKEMTDEYYNIQLSAAETMRSLTERGVDIFVICGYNLELPALVKHYKLSSDNIIQSQSTSAGATFANVGDVLGDGYTPAIDGSYLSPDGIVDAGTCALPDRTWFVKNQSHLKLQSSITDIIEMCVQLVTDKSITDARENNGGYPQFNEYRDLTTVKKLMESYEKSDLSSLPEQKRNEITAAYEGCEKLIQNRTWSQSETDEKEQALYKAMYDAKLLSGSYDSPAVKYVIKPLLLKICMFISRFFSMILGKGDIWLFPVKLL